MNGMLLRRALVEHRAVVVPLGIVLLANLLVFAFVVYPLERRVNTVSERTRAAETELAAARALRDRASATLTGKDRAAAELERFYTDVLPATESEARRLAHSTLELVAPMSSRGVELRRLSTSTQREGDPDDTFTRLAIEARIAGSYADIRRVIHELEQAPEFLVIDGIALVEDPGAEGQLTVVMELSTYYTEAAP